MTCDNVVDLLHDLQETVRQIRHAVSGGGTPARSVKTITREDGRKRNRLTNDQVRELVAAFEAGTTRMQLAKRYGIGRTSVAKLLREWWQPGGFVAARISELVAGQ